MALDDMFRLFVKYKDDLKRNNRFFVDPLYHKYFDRIISDHVRELETGEIFFRARINEFGHSTAYVGSEIGMPPRDTIARAGRANPLGINYFYVANNTATAISEVRPSHNSLVTVGEFTLNRNKQVLFMDRNASISGSIYEELDSMDVAHFMSYLLLGFTTPVIGQNQELEYAPYQYFAEYCKKCKLDGIMFRSAAVPTKEKHYSYVMFKDEDFKFESSTLHRITEIDYTYEMV